MSAQPQPRLTPEQYLAAERAAGFRSEYYDGRVYAMSGGSYRHIVVIGNLSFALRGVLRKRSCNVATSDLRIRVAPNGLYAYPDVVVICGEPAFDDQNRDTVVNPTVILEVLLPTTEAYDRGFKAAQYRTLESLQEYALVSQSEPRVEVFRRQADGVWLFSEYVGTDSVFQLESLACQIPLAEIYEKVTFGTEELPGAASKP